MEKSFVKKQQGKNMIDINKIKPKKIEFNDCIKSYQRNEFFNKKIEIRLTEKCNKNCYYCGSDGIMNERIFEFDFEELKKTINTFKKENYFILFSGGEPFIYSKISDLLKYLKEINYLYNTLFISNFDFNIKKYHKEKVFPKNLISSTHTFYFDKKDYNNFYEKIKFVIDNEMINKDDITIALILPIKNYKLMLKNIDDFIQFNENLNELNINRHIIPVYLDNEDLKYFNEVFYKRLQTKYKIGNSDIFLNSVDIKKILQFSRYYNYNFNGRECQPTYSITPKLDIILECHSFDNIVGNLKETDFEFTVPKKIICNIKICHPLAWHKFLYKDNLTLKKEP